nr:hypothetical protein [Tanacetum cinerariifolium]
MVEGHGMNRIETEDVDIDVQSENLTVEKPDEDMQEDSSGLGKRRGNFMKKYSLLTKYNDTLKLHLKDYGLMDSFSTMYYEETINIIGSLKLITSTFILMTLMTFSKKIQLLHQERNQPRHTVISENIYEIVDKLTEILDEVKYKQKAMVVQQQAMMNRVVKVIRERLELRRSWKRMEQCI